MDFNEWKATGEGRVKKITKGEFYIMFKKINKNV